MYILHKYTYTTLHTLPIDFTLTQVYDVDTSREPPDSQPETIQRQRQEHDTVSDGAATTKNIEYKGD